MLFIWTEFTICAIFIVVAGTKLSRYGDIIANKTGISGSWIGLILLATVTSLPELIVGFSSLVLVDAPNIAAGSIFGSCVFNLAILIVLDFLLRGESIYRRASQNHILSAGFGVVLIGFAGLNVLLINKIVIFNFAHIGVYTPVILLLYLIAMRAVFIHESGQEYNFSKK
jgi:cation:H+ antiporter